MRINGHWILWSFYYCWYFSRSILLFNHWGAILPVAYIVLLTWMLISNRIESTIGYVLYLLPGLLFLIAEWNGGRKYFHEKRKKN